MSVKRMVVVADDHNMKNLVQALVAAGVRPGDIHVTPSSRTQELKQLGVQARLPEGQIVFRTDHMSWPAKKDPYYGVP
jgi:hypothetical protein